MAGYWKNDPFGPSAHGEVIPPPSADGTKVFFPLNKKFGFIFRRKDFFIDPVTRD
jgi:hypothetical protein